MATAHRAALLLGLLLASCASGASLVPGEAPVLAPGVTGGIGWYRNHYSQWESVWGNGRVAAGQHDGYPARSFERLPDGRWRSGVTILTATSDRITGQNVNVSYTRVDGGFRLSGLWLGKNVELVVDGRGATAQGMRYVREADGAYVSKDVPGWRIFLVGEAARLDDPPWPELALAALLGGWGVQGLR
jgi:hypothetical protein